MDSSALGLLLDLRNQSLAANRYLTLTSPSGVAMQILDVACFASVDEVGAISLRQLACRHHSIEQNAGRYPYDEIVE